MPASETRYAPATLINGVQATHRYRTMAGRFAAREQILAGHIGVLEEYEKNLFEQLGGKYVQTGALRDSLTLSEASGAIREITPAGVNFGTSIWYAHFQRAIDGPSGVPRGRKRYGPNLVLKLSELEQRALAQSVFDFVFRGL